MDEHYTPTELAKLLVASVSRQRPQVVADLTAGRGHLLAEAEKRWPTAKYIATDVSQSTVRGLRRDKPRWMIGRVDLQSRRSRASCKVLKGVKGKVSLLLLNPPFSCRGGTRVSVETVAGPIECSTALSFLLIAAEYLAPTGVIAIIMPAGSIHNAKDANAWRHLRSRYRIQLLSSHGKGTFPRCSASTTLLRLGPREKQHIHDLEASSSVSPRPLAVRLIRGCFPSTSPASYETGPIRVHSTDLKQARVQLNGRRGYGMYRCVRGPALLLPRVGQVTEEKLAILSQKVSVMPTDCVIALKTSSVSAARQVRQRIVAAFPEFERQYVGTGAPFVTMDRLRSALRRAGVVPDEP